MKHEKIDNIDDKARVWSVTLGTDGRLRAEIEERLLSTIDPLAHALVIAAGREEIAATRAW